MLLASVAVAAAAAATGPRTGPVGTPKVVFRDVLNPDFQFWKGAVKSDPEVAADPATGIPSVVLYHWTPRYTFELVDGPWDLTDQTCPEFRCEAWFQFDFTPSLNAGPARYGLWSVLFLHSGGESVAFSLSGSGASDLPYFFALSDLVEAGVDITKFEGVGFEPRAGSSETVFVRDLVMYSPHRTTWTTIYPSGPSTFNDAWYEFSSSVQPNGTVVVRSTKFAFDLTSDSATAVVAVDVAYDAAGINATLAVDGVPFFFWSGPEKVENGYRWIFRLPALPGNRFSTVEAAYGGQPIAAVYVGTLLFSRPGGGTRRNPFPVFKGKSKTPWVPSRATVVYNGGDANFPPQYVAQVEVKQGEVAGFYQEDGSVDTRNLACGTVLEMWVNPTSEAEGRLWTVTVYGVSGTRTIKLNITGQGITEWRPYQIPLQLLADQLAGEFRINGFTLESSVGANTQSIRVGSVSFYAPEETSWQCPYSDAAGVSPDWILSSGAGAGLHLSFSDFPFNMSLKSGKAWFMDPDVATGYLEVRGIATSTKAGNNFVGTELEIETESGDVGVADRLLQTEPVPVNVSWVIRFPLWDAYLSAGLNGRVTEVRWKVTGVYDAGYQPVTDPQISVEVTSMCLGTPPTRSPTSVPITGSPSTSAPTTLDVDTPAPLTDVPATAAPLPTPETYSPDLVAAVEISVYTGKGTTSSSNTVQFTLTSIKGVTCQGPDEDTFKRLTASTFTVRCPWESSEIKRVTVDVKKSTGLAFDNLKANVLENNWMMMYIPSQNNSASASLVAGDTVEYVLPDLLLHLFVSDVEGAGAVTLNMTFRSSANETCVQFQSLDMDPGANYYVPAFCDFSFAQFEAVTLTSVASQGPVQVDLKRVDILSTKISFSELYVVGTQEASASLKQNAPVTFSN
ncbi:hypothetical protein DIPPA_29325 [Diplonema papillatum]|nr:hypothetical protein DIPPA_29325 [Diplonema papillatum]